MDIYLGSEDDDFLVRRGAIYAPSESFPVPSTDSHLRVVEPLINEELDNLVRKAFDCNEAEDTFRGQLRQAVENVKPDALTSICAYRIGFEFDAMELSLLVTVIPGSLTERESVDVLLQLAFVLEDYDKRFGALAIEVAEQAILLAGRNDDEFEEISYEKEPAKRFKPMSRFGPCPSPVPYPSPGSDVDLQCAFLGVGTLGAFLHGRTRGMGHCYFGLTCHHVLSSYEMPIQPGRGMSTVLCPAHSTSAINWCLAQDNIIKVRNTAFAETEEAQRLRWGAFEPNTSIGTMYASSGLRVTPDHWVLDWALVKLDPTQVSCQLLHNVPSTFMRELFEHDMSQAVLEKMDWHRYGKYATVRKSSRAFRVGDMTSDTASQFHDIDPSVTICYPADTPDGKRYVAVRGKMLAVRPGYSDFADFGDGGALVLNGHAGGVGIVTALAEGSVADGVVYVSPLGQNIEDMKEMLRRGPGEKVEVEFV